MTEPKPTRFLSQRLLGWAEGKAEEIRAALVAADDAHVALADDPTEEEYR